MDDGDALTPKEGHDLYLTAKEAAAALDVSVATLYSYVSRGFVRTHRTPGIRVSRYWRPDIERFKQRSVLDPSCPAAIGQESSISLRTDTELFYRGVNAVLLAETHSFEAVAALLWQLPEADLFADNLPILPADYATLVDAFAVLGHTDQIAGLAPFLERSNPRCFDLTPAAFGRAGAAAMRWFAATVALPCAPSDRPIHMVLARTEKADDPVADIVRRLLVLSADHAMDPTTLAVRAVANTGVTPYRIIMTGLIASEGRRGSFGRMQSVARLLGEILHGNDPASPILTRLKDGEALPGFGSHLYKGRDARAAALLGAVRQRVAHLEDVAKFLRAVDVARDATGLEPDFALAHLLVCRLIGLSGRRATILRLPRVAGWLAHAMEQFGEHELIRLRPRYSGTLPA